jgi:hypothetical protein
MQIMSYAYLVSSLYAPPKFSIDRPNRQHVLTPLFGVDETALTLGHDEEPDLGVHILVAHAVLAGNLGVREFEEEASRGQAKLDEGEILAEADLRMLA